MKNFKKIFAAVSVLTALTAGTFALSGCAKKIGGEQAFNLMKQAVAESFKQDIYYIKSLAENDDGSKTIRNINVYADVNDNYEFTGGEVKDGYRVHAYEALNGKAQYEFWCGESKPKKAEAANAFFLTLFKENDKGNSEVSSRQKQTLTAKQLTDSEYFAEFYSLSSFIQELDFMTIDDVTFDVPNKNLTDGNKIDNIYFRLKPEYFERFEQNGRKSRLHGDFVFVETAFNRISNVTCYMNDALLGVIPSEREIYKAEIVYLGPKFAVPDYSKKDKNGAVWGDGIVWDGSNGIVG